MPRTKKDNRKRRLGYVLGSLDRAMTHCLEIKADFDDSIGLDPQEDGYEALLMGKATSNAHAKLAFLLHVSLKLMLQAQQLMEDFATHAYGHVPDKVERWTSTGQDYRKKKLEQAADGLSENDL